MLSNYQEVIYYNFHVFFINNNIKSLCIPIFSINQTINTMYYNLKY